MAPTSHLPKVKDTVVRTLKSNIMRGSKSSYYSFCHHLRCAILAGFGTHDNEGDVDFFPNGGEHQPGCTEDPGSSALYNLLHGGLGNMQSIKLKTKHPLQTSTLHTQAPINVIFF